MERPQFDLPALLWTGYVADGSGEWGRGNLGNRRLLTLLTRRPIPPPPPPLCPEMEGGGRCTASRRAWSRKAVRGRPSLPPPLPLPPPRFSVIGRNCRFFRISLLVCSSSLSSALRAADKLDRRTDGRTALPYYTPEKGATNLA